VAFVVLRKIDDTIPPNLSGYLIFVYLTKYTR